MKLAIVFPGQGSQAVGMMNGWGDHPIVRATFDEASDALGQDLWALVADGPAEDLNLTTNTQPVMLTAGVAAWRAWLAAGGSRPVLLAGHSLGEYTALVAAGAMAFRDAVPLVRYRAQAMQDAVPAGVGAMAAIMGAPDDESVIAACAEAAQRQVVEAVNFNAPGQLVIAGHREAVERAVAVARTKGAKRGVMLPVSAPFHSSLLRPAAERLAARLAEVTIAATTIPVLHNVDVLTHATPDEIRHALAQQAAHPVRWTATMQAMGAQGITQVVECGPGKVLAGLAKRSVEGVQAYSLTDGEALAATLAELAAR
ncbi:MAG: ACP S-malonyltransferase [Casimicrobiaceae bacterium]